MFRNKIRYLPIFLCLCFDIKVTMAFEDVVRSMDDCLLTELKAADKSFKVKDIYLRCQKINEHTQMKKGAISKRLASEYRTASDPYVITPHKMNYILPISVSDGINANAYDDSGDWSESLDNREAKFQLSIKVPLNTGELFTKHDGLFFGFTLKSWWQVYSNRISKPFRETNYQPEIFYLTPLDWHPGGGNTGLLFGIEHQSNGRSQLLSRSWNRAYFSFLYEKGNFALSFKPWWRLPEKEKKFITASKGDDNPDIIDYMGHFELAMAYEWDEYEFSIKARENFNEHHGGVEVGFTFPLWGKIRGFIQYSSGYGESLIDYNHSQQRVGLGIALTDVL